MYPGPVIHVKSNSLLTKCGVTGISMCQLEGRTSLGFSRFDPDGRQIDWKVLAPEGKEKLLVRVVSRVPSKPPWRKVLRIL